MKLKKKTKGNIFMAAGLTVNVGAPLVTTLTQFPAWVERSAGSTVSGIFVVFALLSVIPIFKHIKQITKSPSVPMLWGVGCALLFCLRNIIDEMIVICLVGCISNLAGMGIYKYGEMLKEKEE